MYLGLFTLLNGCFISNGRKEGRASWSSSVESKPGILFQSFVDTKGTCGEDFSEQRLAGCSYQTVAQRSWPSGPDKLSPASRKCPFGELLGRSAELLLPYNKSFFSQPCINFSPQHFSTYSHTAEGNNEAFLPSLPFLSLTFTSTGLFL